MAKKPSIRVLEIALEYGFSNHGHFNESIRKRYICNPSQCRLRMKASHSNQ
ncbi:AraC-like DNA-binding protein [Pseudomonas frederiksbergensis]|uniref:hypothetical protein n=1 Tax=Pseudomonas frederiksbergensis TaxID=104087 RepID=UPI003D24F9EE